MTTVLEILPSLGLAFVAVFVGLMSPGPNILAVIGTSVRSGRRAGSALALGVAVGSGLWAALAVTGFTTIMATWAEVVVVMKVLGGAYLIWLGIKSFRSAATKKDLHGEGLELGDSALAYFRRGLTVQMTNPKAALAMLAIVSIGVTTRSPIWVSVVLVTGIFLMSLVGHQAYALAFSTQRVVKVYLRARRGVEATLGAIFCFAGLKLIFGEK